jgi:hypothetical protein
MNEYGKINVSGGEMVASRQKKFSLYRNSRNKNAV